MNDYTKLHKPIELYQEDFAEVMVWDQKSKVFLPTEQVHVPAPAPKTFIPKVKPSDMKVALEIGLKGGEALLYLLLLVLSLIYSMLCLIAELLKMLYLTSKYSRPKEPETPSVSLKKTNEAKHITVNVNINA